MAQLMADSGSINCGDGFTRVHCRYFARFAKSLSSALGDEWVATAQPSIVNAGMSKKALRIVLFSDCEVFIRVIIGTPMSAPHNGKVQEILLSLGSGQSFNVVFSHCGELVATAARDVRRANWLG